MRKTIISSPKTLGCNKFIPEIKNTCILVHEFNQVRTS